MFSNLTGWHALILLAVVLLLFGATRLPALARSVGQSARIFKQETRSPESKYTPAQQTTASAATAPKAEGRVEPLSDGHPR